MIRGTTAQFRFKTPYPPTELEWITIKFWQPGNKHELLPIIRTKTNCSSTDNENELCVSLDATETKRFSDKYKAKVQLRAHHVGTGTTFGSRTQSINVYSMDDDIINNDAVTPSPVTNSEGWVIFDGDSIVS